MDTHLWPMDRTFDTPAADSFKHGSIQAQASANLHKTFMNQTKKDKDNMLNEIKQ